MSTETPKVDALEVLKAAIKRTSPTTHFNERANLWATHDAMAELIKEASRAERLLRDMAEAGWGDPTQANDLRAALARFGGAA